MALQPGTTLGPYEIQSPLGAGGMGEVYKATDTRLDRTVKLLTTHLRLADRRQNGSDVCESSQDSRAAWLPLVV